MAAALRELRPLVKLGAKVFRSNTFACFSFHNTRRFSPVYSIGYIARQQELPLKLPFRTLCNEKEVDQVDCHYGGLKTRLRFWYLKLMVDPSLDIDEIAEGSLQGLRYFHELMRERDFQSMEGIVSKDFIAELQNSEGKHRLFKIAEEAREEQYSGAIFRRFGRPKKDTISARITIFGVVHGTIVHRKTPLLPGCLIEISSDHAKTKLHSIDLEKEITKDKSGQWQIKEVSVIDLTKIISDK